jgi:hypothetical protein
MYTLAILDLVAFLFTATLYQGDLDRTHMICDIIVIERYIIQLQVLLKCGMLIKMESAQCEN